MSAGLVWEVKMRFYKCKKCGQLTVFLDKNGAFGESFNELMEEVKPGTTDAAHEKHVPVVERDGNKVTVKVGSVAHPMTEAHLIDFIVLETSRGFQVKQLTHEDKPEAEFLLAEGEDFVAAYEHCNLHGLWMAK